MSRHRINPELKKLSLGACVVREIKDFMTFMAVQEKVTLAKLSGNILTNWVYMMREGVLYDKELKDKYLKYRLDQKPKVIREKKEPIKGGLAIGAMVNKHHRRGRY